MAERGSIVMDIRAQVSGYEQSLRKLQAEFAKVDPGSQIGKSLTRAIQTAETQLKALNKNLTPRVTSDSQIDNITDKVNTLGETIQSISAKMRQVDVGDLNLSVLGKEFETLQQQIVALENELTGKFNKGIQDAVASSSQLQDVFTNILKVDSSKMTADQMFTALQDGAKKTSKEVDAAQASLDKIQRSINTQQNTVKNKQEGLFGSYQSRDQLLEQARNFQQQYEAIFENVKGYIRKGFERLSTAIPKEEQDELIEQFFAGLTPENLKAKLEALFNRVAADGSIKNIPSRFFTKFFHGSINQADAERFFDFGAVDTIRTKFREFVESLGSEIGGNNKSTILELIDKNRIEDATSTTMVNINTAYGKVQNTIQKALNEIDRLMKEKTTAQGEFDTAQAARNAVIQVDAQLRQMVEDVSAENEDLKKQLDEVKQQLLAKKQAAAGRIQQTGREEGLNSQEINLGTEELQKYKSELEQVHEREQLVGKIEGVVQRWFSIYAAVRMVGNAIRSVISTLKELDATITEIAIVTNMTQQDLWNQMSDYTAMAQKYAASISGVYKVSQLYYQQGLQTADVMALTEQTLKMARISGLDYAEATDYMTNAVRSFKMEMTEAQTVVDVYSAIAAKSATNVTELAEAMSKTASSAESVGSSFENTTAMMAVMIEATRESATNIGSAMKSIISRYGEMKANPSKLIDSEGEAISLNKVDTALQSVGISIHDVNGQFRDFDEVIMELAKSWNTIDKNTQRYIATVMAGNRQQSRFLALVSSYDRLKELSAEAANSEDAAQLQFLKTLDSIAAKTQQLQTSLQNLYVDSGLERFYGFLIDAGRSIVDTFNNMPKLFDLPILAIGKFGVAFWSIARIVTAVAKSIRTKLLTEQKVIESNITLISLQEQNKRVQNEIDSCNRIIQAETSSVEEARAAYIKQTEAFKEQAKIREDIAKEEAMVETNSKLAKPGILTSLRGSFSKEGHYIGQTMLGLGLSSMGSSIAASSNKGSPRAVFGGLTSAAGSAFSGFTMGSMMGAGLGPWGAAIGGIIGLVQNIPNMIVTAQERLNQLQEEAEEKNNEAIKARSEANTFNQQLEQIRKLEKARYDNVEAEEEYYEAANKMAETYPELIKSLDKVGNATIDTAAAEEELNNIRKQSVKSAKEAAIAENKVKDTKVGQAMSDSYISETQLLNTIINRYNDTTKTDNVFGYGTEHGFYYTDVQTGNVRYENEYLEEINDLLTKDNALDKDKVDNIKTKIQNFKENNYKDLDNEQQEFADVFLEQTLAFINEHYSEILSEQESASSTRRAGIAKVISASLVGFEDEYLDEIVDISSILTSQAMTAFEESNTDYTDFINNKLSEKNKENQENWNKFWSNLHTQQDKDEFNQLLKLNKKITANQMRTQLESFNLDSYGINIDDIIKTFYTNTYDSIRFLERYSQKNVSLLAQSINNDHRDLYDKLAESELQAINTFYDYLENNLITNGGSLSMQQAQDVLNNYLTIGEKLSTIKDPDLKEQAEAIFYSWDGSLSNLIEIERSLKDLGIDTTIWDQINKIIERLKTEIPINFSMALQSYADSISQKMEDYEKDLSNAAKGLNLKDAVDMAQKINKDLSVFDFRNGKYYLKDIADLEEKYFDDTEYLDALNNKKQQREQAYNDYSNMLQSIQDGKDISFFDIAKNGKGNTYNNKKDWNNQLTNFLSKTGISLEQLQSIYNTYSSEMASVAKDEQVSFQNWLIAQNNAEYDLIVAKTEQYKQYTKAASYLTSGDITNFLKAAGIKDEDITQDLIQKVARGDISDLPEQLQQFAKLIYDTYHSIYSSITDNMLKAAEGGSNKIEVTNTNQQALQDAMNKGLLENQKLVEGNFIEVNVKKFKESEEVFSEWIQTAYDNEQDRYKALTSFHNIEYADISGSMSSVITDNGEIAYSSLMKYFETLGKTSEEAADALGKYGLEIDKQTGTVKITDLNEYIKQLKEDAQQFKNDTEKYNETMAKLYDAQHYKEIQRKKAYEQVLKNYNSLSSTDRADFATALGDEFDKVAKYFEEEDDGTFKLNIGKIRKALEDGTLKIGKVTETYLQELIYGIVDDYLDAISSGIGYTTSGLTKQADMRKFVNDFNNKLKTTYNISDLFSWDTILEAYTLKPEYLSQYIAKQRELLKTEFDNDADVDKYIESQLKAITQAVDIPSFLQSENTQNNSRSRKILENQMRTALNIQANWKQAANYIDGAIEMLASGTGGNYELIYEEAWKIAVEEANKQNEKINDEINTQVQSDLFNFEKGGKAAIEILKKYAGDRELTAEEIEAAYRVRLNNLSQAFESIATLQRGNVVDQNTRAILNKIAGFAVNADGVIISTGNMIDAYQVIYEEMKKTSVATTAELNSAYAKLLTAKEQNEINAIDTLGNAMSMAYDALGELLSQYNMSLEMVLQNTSAFGIEQLGTGKVRIKDFNRFAARMGWNPESEEYWDAFKTYNDSLIELNKNTKTAIEDEIKSLQEAKSGDQINLTNLWKELGSTLTFTQQTMLRNVGATFSKGILTLSDDAQIIQVAKLLTQYAEEAGITITDEMQDTIQSIIKTYSDAIIKGIQGGMTNVEAADLQAKALSLGITNIDFTETIEGLKLSQESAIELYYTLSNVDSLQAQLVFKELNNSLKESNEHYKTTSSLMTHIKELQNAINAADSKTNPTRIQQYKQELELAKEIAKVRLTTEDSSFDFMSTDLNGALNNAPKYYEAWAKAAKSAVTAAEEGYIGWEDYTRIVNEIQNLAVQTGHDMLFMGQTINSDGTSAAKLIEEGYKALDIDVESGTAILNLDTLLTTTGLDFKQGAEGFSATIDDGIKEFAKGQVKMLDGMIQLLETIVAMEQLGDIDSESFELFDGKDFSSNYQKFIDYVTNSIADGNTDLKDAFNNISINGNTLTELLGMTPEQLRELGPKFEAAYSNILVALNKAAQSGDWDTAWDVIKEQLVASGVDGLEIDLDNVHYVFKNGIMLEKNEKGFIYNGKTYPNERQALTAAFTSGLEVFRDKVIETADDTNGNTIKYTGNYDIEVEYNAENETYTAIIDGTTLSSNTPEGLNYAILAYEEVNGLQSQIDSDSVDTTPITFSIYKEGEVELNVEIKDDEITIHGKEAKDYDEIEGKYTEATKKVLEKEAEKIEQLNLSASENAQTEGITNIFQITVSKIELDAEDADVEFQKDKEPKKSVTLSHNINTIVPGANLSLENGPESVDTTQAEEEVREGAGNLDANLQSTEQNFPKVDVGTEDVDTNSAEEKTKTTAEELTIPLGNDEESFDSTQIETEKVDTTPAENETTTTANELDIPLGDKDTQFDKTNIEAGSVNTDQAKEKTQQEAEQFDIPLGDNEESFDNTQINSGPVNTEPAKNTIQDAANNFNLDIGSAIVNFAELIIGLKQYSGDGINSQRVQDALQNYKDALGTENESKALETLFAALNIDVNNSSGIPAGDLYTYLNDPNTLTSDKSLLCNFALLLLGLQHYGNGDPLSGGSAPVTKAQELINFINTHSTLKENSKLNVLYSILNLEMQKGYNTNYEEFKSEIQTALETEDFSPEEIQLAIALLSLFFGQTDEQGNNTGKAKFVPGEEKKIQKAVEDAVSDATEDGTVSQDINQLELSSELTGEDSVGFNTNENQENYLNAVKTYLENLGYKDVSIDTIQVFAGNAKLMNTDINWDTTSLEGIDFEEISLENGEILKVAKISLKDEKGNDYTVRIPAEVFMNSIGGDNYDPTHNQYTVEGLFVEILALLQNISEEDWEKWDKENQHTLSLRAQISKLPEITEKTGIQQVDEVRTILTDWSSSDQSVLKPFDNNGWTEDTLKNYYLSSGVEENEYALDYNEALIERHRRQNSLFSRWFKENDFNEDTFKNIAEEYEVSASDVLNAFKELVEADYSFSSYMANYYKELKDEDKFSYVKDLYENENLSFEDIFNLLHTNEESFKQLIEQLGYYQFSEVGYELTEKAYKDKQNKFIEEFKNKDNYIIPVEADPSSAIDTAKTAAKEITDNISATMTINANVNNNSNIGMVGAKGNVALSKGTLMGELGPELYVTNGRYFVAGQNGAEFVNLPKDAIVFNHLQTQKLLNNGSSSRGKPITNEKNAVSYAKGTGPAMASASSVLATLKQLRAQWQAIADMSVADLAGKGGGGGGGGQEDLPGFIRDVERWYNWLQKIADLEKQINYEETLRSKIQSDMVSNGKAYYASQKRQLDQLRDSTITSSSLYLSQLDYFNKRREQLNNNSPLSELYTFDTTGQLHYQPGSYQWLAQLFKTNDYGQLELTPKQQYEMIMKRNPQFAQYMKYNSEGKEIKASDYEDQAQYYLDMVKAFSDRMDSEKEEMQSLFDSINEQGNAVNEKLQKQNELIQAMRDNQKEVEESVLDAIVESREREIKEIQDTKDALQKSNEDFINGLSDQLEKERKLYDNNQNDEELNRNRRQLAILQRSGGSAAQIASLQKQIEEQSRDQYFEKQQEQIDAVREASDLQIERLDRQIELMNETLEYQKANGLLWNQVYEVMAGTPQQISDFIMQNTAAEWAKSPLSSTEAANDWIFKTEQWVSFRDDIEGIYDALTATWNMFDKEMENLFGADIWSGANKDAIKDIFNAKYIETGDYNEAAKAAMQSDVYKGMKNKLDASLTPINTSTQSQTQQQQGNHGFQFTYGSKTYYWQGYNSAEEAYQGALYFINQLAKADRDAAVKGFNDRNQQNPTLFEYDLNKINNLMNTAKKSIKAYKNGGLIDYTGPAWVDGTKQKPESIWDAETTKLMKDNLLNSHNLNLLGTFWDTLQDYQTATNHSYSNNSESLVIENAVVNMNVASIANDYDARRAGEQAMEEMLRIARKTRVSNF